MVKRSKDDVPVAKLSSSNEAVTNVKSKCAELWSLVKQVWYVPFIWSLAWFSYWIFQEKIVLSHPVTQGNYLNYFGFAISIMAILAKGWLSKKSRKENAEKTRKTIIDESNSPESNERLREIMSKESKYWESEQLKPKPKPCLSIDKIQIQEPTDTPIESVGSPIPTRKTSSKEVNLNQNMHQEIPTDCLLCPNLTNCDQRQKRLDDPGIPCPLASTTPKNDSE